MTITISTFEIGREVFTARFGRHEHWVTCPDCLGSRHVMVTLGDGTEVLIECGGCDPGGYSPSTGRIRQYRWTGEFQSGTVTGVRTTTAGVSYWLDGSTFAQKEVFGTAEEALAAAELLKVAHEQDENKRLMAKTKDHRTWKWNASYHRKEIKRLENSLEYHRAKVSICSAKAKK